MLLDRDGATINLAHIQTNPFNTSSTDLAAIDHKAPTIPTPSAPYTQTITVEQQPF